MTEEVRMMDRIVTNWWRAFTSPRLYKLVAQSRRVTPHSKKRQYDWFMEK